MPIECVTTTWECEYCYREFDYEDECEEHENECPRNPNYSEITGDAVTPVCKVCEHCTREGYYRPDCKIMHATLPVHECSMFQPARDLN